MGNKRERFTPEFKREAVRMLEAGDKPAAEVAMQLGIRRNKLQVAGAAAEGRRRGVSGVRPEEGR